MSHFLALNFSKSRQRKKSAPKITKFPSLRSLVIPNQTFGKISQCKSIDMINDFFLIVTCLSR